MSQPNTSAHPNPPPELESASRRQWLTLAASSAALGSLALFTDAKSFNSGATWPSGTPVRRNIGALSPDDGYVQAYRDAVKVLRQRSKKDPLDPTGWDALAIQHALYCSSVSPEMQIHWGWDFLTWHRASIWMQERIMRDAIKEPKFALPYWDASRYPRIPAAYWGKGNPLFDPSRLQEPGDEIPDDLLDIAGPMTLDNFFAFGGYPYDNPSGDMVEGSLEGGYHNNVHNWIGGNMAMFATAGFEPLFSAHHNNIDRAWEAWRKARPGKSDPTNGVWLNRQYQFIDERGRRENVRVADILNTEQMGYVFEDFQFGQRRKPDPVLNAAHAIVIPAEGAIASGGRQGKVLQFERSIVPLHPYCCRVFLQPKSDRPNPDAAVYVGTFTVLPVQRGGAKTLDAGVTMQLALTESMRARLASHSNLEVVLAGVPLKGRDIPTQAIRPQRVRIVDALI